jgi:riboflavin transporter FmnP
LDKSEDDRPLAFKAVSWYAHIFAGMFILYGGVKMILSFLDHQYQEIGQWALFLILGLILIVPAVAYKNLKSWSWYGLVVINALVALVALTGITNPYNAAWLVLSLGVLALLFISPARSYLFERS